MADTPEKDDRTEEPTQRRLDQAIERGDVAKSPEISTFFVLGGFALAILLLSGPVARTLALDLRGFLMNAHLVPSDGAGLTTVSRGALMAWATAVAMPLGVLMLAGLAGGAIQHRPLWSGEPLRPQLSRLSPLSGTKRVFGREAVAQFVKGLLKILIVGSVAGAVLWSERDRLDAFARLDPGALLAATLSLTTKLLGGVLAIYAFLAIGDAIYQRVSWRNRQRMTQRELKEEFKETPRDQGAPAPDPPDAAQEADDGRGPEGDHRRGESDPLCGRAAIRDRHGGTALRREGRRRARAAHPGRRGRAWGAGDRKPAARPGASCERRSRRGDSCRTL
jgi:flagellar biosynthetic protein FlhB